VAGTLIQAILGDYAVAISTRSFVVALCSSVFAAGLVASAGQTPPLGALVVPEGFHADVFADNVENAREMTLGPQGTVFVGSLTAGKVYAVVDRGDHKAERVVVIASGLKQPNGVAMRNGALYVATASRLLRFDDIEKHLDAPPAPVTVRDNLPNPDQGHLWKFIAFGPDDLLYMSVGSTCNICAPAAMTAAIVRMKPDGSGMEVFAEGVRNSVGFDWHPVTHELWFTDNGRDMLGDDVPNDELNIAPKAGLHFGFPYCHQGDVPDPEFGAQRACSTTESPVLKLGAHVAAIGFTCYTGKMFPANYRNAAIIAEHGSWNRTPPSGYRVMVAHTDGRRVAGYEPLVDGFLPGMKSGSAPGGWAAGKAAIGRPADVLEMPDGSILVSDDSGNRLIRVSYGQ
jgi:glucose/arabinose dehydrogenase